MPGPPPLPKIIKQKYFDFYSGFLVSDYFRAFVTQTAAEPTGLLTPCFAYVTLVAY